MHACGSALLGSALLFQLPAGSRNGRHTDLHFSCGFSASVGSSLTRFKAMRTECGSKKVLGVGDPISGIPSSGIELHFAKAGEEFADLDSFERGRGRTAGLLASLHPSPRPAWPSRNRRDSGSSSHFSWACLSSGGPLGSPVLVMLRWRRPYLVGQKMALGISHLWAISPPTSHPPVQRSLKALLPWRSVQTRPTSSRGDCHQESRTQHQKAAAGGGRAAQVRWPT